MARRDGSRRLAGVIALAALVASASVGLLWGAQRGGRVSPVPGKGQKQPAKSGATKPAGPAAAPKQPAPLPGFEIVSPQSEAKLRGVAVVKGDWPGGSGYVVFRVDGEFVYASTSPYEVRWDTSTVADGSHIIRADAYDNSGNYAGSSSIKVLVENTIPTPEGGVLLTVKFGEHDIFNRIVTGRGEMSALRADQVLPQGFDVLAGELRGELNQTVLDAYYEGVTALVRNRLRTASLTAEALRQSVPEVGQYTMVQVSRNGLTIPASSATNRPRLGLGEVSLAFADYPVLPGDTWESPLGAVYDLYTRRAIFVQARHTFEGLRWFRGRECAVVSSSYTLPELPLLEKAPAAQPQTTAAAAIGDGFQVALTGGRRGGGGMRGGGGRVVGA